MSFLSYLRVELNRIFHSHTTWLVIVLTILCPLAGYKLYQPAGTTTSASAMLANPVLAGGLGGAVLFALLALFECDRVNKNQTNALTDSIASPITLSVARLFAVLSAALVATLLTAIIYLPYTMYRMDMVFTPSDYVRCFLILMLPSLWLAILALSAFYQIFRRMDLSFVLFVAIVIFSLSKWSSAEYLLRWINPLVPILSSDFSNNVVFKTASYNRLCWFALFIGLWLFSLMCVRNHGKGLFGSIGHNARKAYLPIIAVLLITQGCYLYTVEPYIDHCPLAPPEEESTGGDISVSFGGKDEDRNENLTLLDTKLTITFDTKKSTLYGIAKYRVQNNSGQREKCRLEINPGYTIEQIVANGKEIKFTDLHNDHDVNVKDILCELPADRDIKLEVVYGGSPKIWSAMREQFSDTQIEQNYVSVGGSTTRPGLMTARAVDAGISGEITLPSELELVSTGSPAKVLRDNGDGTRTWQVHNVRRNISLFAGDYVKLEINGGGMPVYFYYSKKHQAQMEELGIKQVLEETIAYCTKHYGPLPYTKEQPMGILQSSAFMHGGGVFGNISVMDEQTFTKESLVDPEKGATAAEVLAHEITHQWWGLSCYVMDNENQQWSSEGLTVYTTYRMMKEKHGNAYAQKYYVDVWKQSVKNQNDNFYVRHPEYLKMLPEKYQAELQYMIAGSNLYSKMPLQIYQAAQLVGGEEKMDNILAGLYQKGGTEMSPFLTWHDFLNACGLREEELNK